MVVHEKGEGLALALRDGCGPTVYVPVLIRPEGLPRDPTDLPGNLLLPLVPGTLVKSP